MLGNELAKDSPFQKRKKIDEILNKGYLISDILALDKALSVEIQEVIIGVMRDNKQRPTRNGSPRRERFKLATVDGEPLGDVKVGQDPSSITGEELINMEMRGESPDITESYGSDFEVDGERAIFLLKKLGYGITTRRFRRRHAAFRKEKNAWGQAIGPIDEWRLVEVGSKHALRAANELVTRAMGSSTELPAARDDEEAERFAQRALEISPGHEGAQAFLSRKGKKNGSRKSRD